MQDNTKEPTFNKAIPHSKSFDSPSSQANQTTGAGNMPTISERIGMYFSDTERPKFQDLFMLSIGPLIFWLPLIAAKNWTQAIVGAILLATELGFIIYIFCVIVGFVRACYGTEKPYFIDFDDKILQYLG